MSYKPAKWPTYANEGLEDALSLQEDIDRDGARIHKAVLEGNHLELIVLAANIRVAAMKAHSTLIQAKAGEYRRQAS